MKRDKEDPVWKIAQDCLTYYNQEEDKKRYFKAKKFYLKKTLNESDKLKEIEDYSEEQVDELMKKSFPLKTTDNHFYCFAALLNLGQCAFKPEILEFFNKKDFSIYSLYKFAPRYIFELIDTYQGCFFSQHQKLVDIHFVLYCNIIDYFQPTYGIVNKRMKEYIDLTKDKLILLGFTEDEITERQTIIEDIKKNEGSIFSSIYNYFFPKKEESQEVKIKYS